MSNITLNTDNNYELYFSKFFSPAGNEKKVSSGCTYFEFNDAPILNSGCHVFCPPCGEVYNGNR